MKRLLEVLSMFFSIQVFANPAIEELNKTCDAGVGNSCYTLAVAYEIGIEVIADIHKANSLYEKACWL